MNRQEFLNWTIFCQSVDLQCAEGQEHLNDIRKRETKVLLDNGFTAEEVKQTVGPLVPINRKGIPTEEQVLESLLKKLLPLGYSREEVATGLQNRQSKHT